MIKNSYLDIAENDLRYLESVLETGSTFYNQMSVQCQQVAEKFLKGYVDRLFLNEDVSDLLRKHNMKKIAAKLNQLDPDLNLDTIGLAYLTDFYYDARYPGDDFYTVTKEEFDKCLSIMYDTVEKLKKLKVTGYADSDTGSAAWNKQLSEDRANNVANELVKLGVNKNNLIISGMGGVNTLTPPAFNRRVIIEAQ